MFVMLLVGMMGAAFGIGFILGPALGGLLGEQFGPRAPFFAAAMLPAVGGDKPPSVLATYVEEA